MEYEIHNNPRYDQNFQVWRGETKAVASLNIKKTMKLIPELASDLSFMSQAVAIDGLLLKDASPELQSNRELVLKAIKQNPNALEFTTYLIQDDEEVVLEAIQTAVKQGSSRNPLRYASARLRVKKELADLIPDVTLRKTNPLINKGDDDFVSDLSLN